MPARYPTPAFTGVDHHGRPIDHTTYPLALLYCGYTACPTICGRMLAFIDGVLDALGDDATAVQALYLTVDPDTDTPEVMRTFLTAHHPRILGVTGTPEQIHQARKNFLVHARPRHDGSIAHSASIYVLRQGELANYVLPGTLTADEFAAQLRALSTRPLRNP